MTFRQYKYFDLFFFLILGFLSVILSEGLHYVLPNIEYHLMVTLLIIFIVTLRWKFYGIPIFVLSMSAHFFFNSNHLNWFPLSMLFLSQGIGFVGGAYLSSKYIKDLRESIWKMLLAFMISTLLAAVGGSIVILIFEQASPVASIISFLISQLLNILICILFLCILFHSSKDLFSDMKEYIRMKQQEEANAEDEN